MWMRGMKSHWVTCSWIVTLLMVVAPVFAGPYEDEEALFGLYGDEEFISIATGSRQPIAKAPAVATVRTAQDIQNMGATDLDEVLETIPGLHVSRDPFGYQPAYIFRGIYSKFNPQVLVLINGVPLTNLFHGDRGLIWGGMPVNAIARVEVIRGPGSALYGADAFAGVINIVTKNFDDLEDSSFDMIISLSQEAHKKAEEMTRATACETEFWNIIDPSVTEGNREMRLNAYRHTRDDLYEKIKARFRTGPAPRV